MQINSYFKNIRNKILEELSRAEESIQVAVAWFTNFDLFHKLCEKVSNGVNVELIIIDDEINNNSEGVDFQSFIDKGGTLIYANPENPMHNKFCIIDSKVLITGSYNWTYLAENKNFENVTIFKGVSDIIFAYKEEYEDIKKNLERVKVAKKYDIHVENYTSVFDAKNYLASDIYEFALEEQQKGNTQTSLNLINLSLNIKPNNEKYIKKRLEIRDVVYKQWDENYIIDKIELNESETIVHFRTNICDGAWIYSPSCKYAWVLRNTQNINQIYKCKSIKNIALRGEIVKTELPDISILSFKDISQEGDKTQDINRNNEENILDKPGIISIKDGKGVDEKGRSVELLTNSFYGNVELTCEIHFPSINETINYVDLLEGVEAIDKKNHWHCFDIELNRNRLEK